MNGVKAKGASIGGPGPVVVDGMLYLNSGYSRAAGLETSCWRSETSLGVRM